jgi:hypothetical protein
MSAIRQFLILSQLASFETIRQPVVILLVISCVVLTGAVPVLLNFDFGEEGKITRDAGLALYFVTGLFVAGYGACLSFGREIRSGTAQVVLSKPVNRDVFFLSRFVGILFVIICFSYIMLIAILMAERTSERFHLEPGLIGYITDWQTGIMLLLAPCIALFVSAILNYYRKYSFCSTTFASLLITITIVVLISGFFDRYGRWSPFDLRVNLRLIPCTVLISFALIMVSAIVLLLSTRLTLVPTLSLSFAIFICGLLSDYMFGQTARSSLLPALFYRLLPNFQHFWTADAIMGDGSVSWLYVADAGLYALEYTAALLFLGIFMFRRTEVF